MFIPFLEFSRGELYDIIVNNALKILVMILTVALRMTITLTEIIFCSCEFKVLGKQVRSYRVNN